MGEGGSQCSATPLDGSAADAVFPNSTCRTFNTVVCIAGCCAMVLCTAVLAAATRAGGEGHRTLRLRRHISSTVLASSVLACLGVTLRAALHLTGDHLSTGVVLALHVYVQYSYTVYFLWTLCSAGATMARMRKWLRLNDSETSGIFIQETLSRKRRLLRLHAIIWTSAAVICGAEFVIEVLRCEPLQAYAASVVLMLTLVCLPFLYCISILTVKLVVVSRHLSYTDSQRELTRKAQVKLILHALVFTLSWSPTAYSVVHRLLIDHNLSQHTPQDDSLTWISAFVVPLQPLFMSMAFSFTLLTPSALRRASRVLPKASSRSCSMDANAETAYVSFRRSSVRRYSTFGDEIAAAGVAVCTQTTPKRPCAEDLSSAPHSGRSASIAETPTAQLLD